MLDVDDMLNKTTTLQLQLSARGFLSDFTAVLNEREQHVWLNLQGGAGLLHRKEDERTKRKLIRVAL